MSDYSHQPSSTDPESLDQFFRDYGLSLTRTLAYRFPYLSKEDIEDLIQDTLLEAMEKGDEYDPTKGTLRTWITTKAYGKAWRLGRSRMRLTSRPLTDLDPVPVESSAPALRPTMQEVLQQLTPLLQRLTERKANIIRLRFYEMLSVEDIALRLHISESAVRSHISQALRQLRSFL